MKVVLVTYGSDGDTRPMLALAQGLQRTGHEAVVLADRSGESLARAVGVPFRALTGDLATKMRRDGPFNRAVRRGDTTSSVRALGQLQRDHVDEWVTAIDEAADGADLIAAGGLAGYAAVAVAEGRDIPVVMTLLQPMRPTREFLLIGPGFRLPGPVHWAVTMSFMQLGRLMTEPLTNRARRTRGWTTRPTKWTELPVLNGFSPTLCPRPSDWAPTDHVCGDWPLHVPGWEPPDDVVEFLEASAPPVYVGFGSMAGFDPGTVLPAIIEGLGDRRALLAQGWSGMAPDRLPPTVRLIGPTPHDWLFPRCSAVMHHCGAGTTHAAARAGVPQIPMPFAADQPFWARRLRALGVAPTILNRHRLSATRVGHAVAAALRAPVRHAATGVADRMAAEDGVATAVALMQAAAHR